MSIVRDVHSRIGSRIMNIKADLAKVEANVNIYTKFINEKKAEHTTRGTDINRDSSALNAGLQLKYLLGQRKALNDEKIALTKLSIEIKDMVNQAVEQRKLADNQRLFTESVCSA
jgi:hypothetical protein